MNPSKVKEPMQCMDINLRVKTFEEVAYGYQMDEAIREANRCIQCKHKPCISGCPVSIDIPGFIKALTEKDIEKAYDIISDSSLLPAVCGRVCPQEVQCEAVCVRGIKGEPVAIGRLERFVADYMLNHPRNVESYDQEKNGIKVAIVGSGPAGLSCAADLLKLGYQVTLFEALHMLGGVLVYGIPEFRLPKSIVDQEIQTLKKLGAEFKTNMIIGQTLTIDDLFEDGYRAVFLGTGAGLPKFLYIPGETLNGVYTANEFLTRVNLMKAYEKGAQTPIYINQKVAVIGGGNVAMDAARCALRLGAKEVSVIYRRTLEELPARKEEVHHAIEEGIVFHTLTDPIEIIGNNQHFVKSIKCLNMTLSDDIDRTGRRKPVVIRGSEHLIDVDTVIISIGTSPNPLLQMTTQGLDADRYGCLITSHENAKTTRPFVYAGGDAVTGAATVISAMGAGRLAAASIHNDLSNIN